MLSNALTIKYQMLRFYPTSNDFTRHNEILFILLKLKWESV